MKCHLNICSSSKGFTLVEIAVVLVIIGFVTAGLLRMFDGPRSSAKYVEDQQKLADIKASIMAYVARNRTLPCPDTDTNGDDKGEENYTNQHCDASEGYLPHQTLKTHARNAYGERFYYVVASGADDGQTEVRKSSLVASYFGHSVSSSLPSDAKDVAPNFTLETPPTADADELGEGLIFICDKSVEEGSCSTGSQFEASSMLVSVISFGANSDVTWKGGGSNYPANGIPSCPASELTSAEQFNCNHATQEINGVPDARLLHNAQQTKDGFDDVLTWVSAYEVKKLLGLKSGN